jgi:hypothetical protein
MQAAPSDNGDVEMALWNRSNWKVGVQQGQVFRDDRQFRPNPNEERTDFYL